MEGAEKNLGYLMGNWWEGTLEAKCCSVTPSYDWSSAKDERFPCCDWTGENSALRGLGNQ